MAHVKNTGIQPRGFYDDALNHSIVGPGFEADINMSEAYYKKLQELLEEEGDPKPYELTGGAAAASPKGKKTGPTPIEDKSAGKDKDDKK